MTTSPPPTGQIYADACDDCKAGPWERCRHPETGTELFCIVHPSRHAALAALGTTEATP